MIVPKGWQISQIFYNGCFEWSNQIAQTEVDKSLINLQLSYLSAYKLIQGCMANGRSWLYTSVYGSYGDSSYLVPFPLSAVYHSIIIIIVKFGETEILP